MSNAHNSTTIEPTNADLAGWPEHDVVIHHFSAAFDDFLEMPEAAEAAEHNSWALDLLAEMDRGLMAERRTTSCGTWLDGLAAILNDGSEYRGEFMALPFERKLGFLELSRTFISLGVTQAEKAALRRLVVESDIALTRAELGEALTSMRGVVREVASRA